METKLWKKAPQQSYILQEGNQQLARFDFSNRLKVVINTNHQTFVLKRKNGRTRIFELYDQDNRLIAHTTRKKWYADVILFNYGEQEYILKIRNNPLVEVVLQDQEKNDVLAYGYRYKDQKETMYVHEHRAAKDQEDYLLDAVLWIVFMSIPRMDPLEDFLM